MSSVARIAAIARRELAAYFHAPIAYVVGVLFLAVQGFSFWAVVRVLADPARKAPMGAVLRAYFGGTFLYWSFVFVLVATAAMRLVAEDRRQGTWESLLTTPVEDGEAIAGKWLGALGYYTVLWIPTLMFPIVLAIFAPTGAGPELAPVATAYLGVVVTGGGFLAIALAASALSSNQVIAAVAGFAVLMAILFAGQLPELAPSLAGGPVLEYVDIRRHMDAFARGDVDARALAFYGGMIAVGLAAATALVGIGRRRLDDVASRGAAVALIAVIAVLVNVLAARHPAHWDVTASRVNSLEPATREVLARVGAPVRATLVRPGEEGFDEIYDEVERVLARMAERQPLLHVEVVDPLRGEAAVARLADEAGVPESVLLGVGAVVFEANDRVRSVELLDMADLGRDALRAGAVLRFRAEQAFANAIAAVAADDSTLVCATAGQAEMPVAASDNGRDAAALVRRLARDGVRVEAIEDVSRGVPSRCRAVIALAPQRAFSPADAQAIDAHLDGGGGLLLALDARPGSTGALAPRGLAPHGLELVLVGRGIRTPEAVVVDPAHAVDIDLAWAVYRGYGEHPIARGFEDRRLTVWTVPRAVLAEAPAVALASSSSTGWAETNIDSLFEGRAAADTSDLIGPVPVAAASESKGRLVVLGSARPLASDFAGRGAGANAQLAQAAVRWLAGVTRAVDAGEKTPERVRLIMTGGQLAATFAACVVALPLAWAGIGALVWWWRRRRG